MVSNDKFLELCKTRDLGREKGWDEHWYEWREKRPGMALKWIPCIKLPYPTYCDTGLGGLGQRQVGFQRWDQIFSARHLTTGHRLSYTVTVAPGKWAKGALGLAKHSPTKGSSQCKEGPWFKVEVGQKRISAGRDHTETNLNLMLAIPYLL